MVLLSALAIACLRLVLIETELIRDYRGGRNRERDCESGSFAHDCFGLVHSYLLYYSNCLQLHPIRRKMSRSRLAFMLF